MARRRRVRDVALPDKRFFRVAELAEILARHDGERTDALRRRLYRQIERGAIYTVRYLGTLCIPYDEARRIAAGEEVW